VTSLVVYYSSKQLHNSVLAERLFPAVQTGELFLALVLLFILRCKKQQVMHPPTEIRNTSGMTTTRAPTRQCCCRYRW